MRSQRTAFVVLQSFASGLPLGLVWVAIPDWMRDSGVDGGISTGNPIRVRIAFKPTSSIGIKGRHDPCVAIRGAPVVEAMVALVLADHKLLHRGQCGSLGDQ